MISLIFVTNVFATSVSLDESKSKAEFLAIGSPSALKIKGQGASVKGELSIAKDIVTGDLLVNLDEFKTGISTRDNHMKEKYLHTYKAENKVAKLSITKIDLPADYWKLKSEAKNINFVGQLSLHGTQKEVKGILNLNGAENNSVKGESTFKLKLSEYGIDIPSFAGITVAEDVDVKVEFLAKLSE